MSPVDPEIPAAGEEIHLPGGSLQPLMLTLGITLTLIGVTLSIVLVVAGAILSLWTIVRWVQDTRRDISHLPVHDDSH
jgi:membrane protein implicated in regulation of membrane protease activity